MSHDMIRRRREHNLLLISRIFDVRQRASPFTVILDSLEQSGRPLVRTFIQQANANKARVVFLSFETIEKARGVSELVKAYAGRDGPTELHRKITTHLSKTEDTLLVIDSLNALAELLVPDSLAPFLSSLITPKTSLVGTFHTDIPPLPQATDVSGASCYAAPALTVLKYLSTTVLTSHCLLHVLAQKRARDRSLVEPTFGLAAGVEGVVVGLGANGRKALVVEMEYRRKSGRGVTEWFVMSTTTTATTATTTRSMRSKAASGGSGHREQRGIMLLEEYPPYRNSSVVHTGAVVDEREQLAVQMESTFSLELSEKQRRDREGVVLPYFDAQRAEGGAAEGGRILYEMGVEDDFDDEEDEI
ncbi:MAG: hypothetical protein M1816_000463 [Peltula sp. TS41687]|nr:MAG: hypothetical protein M1816_000463 [Peltula sp. TS41687]